MPVGRRVVFVIVDTREAVVLDLGYNPEDGPEKRALVTVSAWGDLLLVVATGYHSLTPVRALIDIAASVQPVNEQTWHRLATRAHSG